MLTNRKAVMENTETAPEGHEFVVSQGGVWGVWGAGKTQAEALKNADKYGKLSGKFSLYICPEGYGIDENGYVSMCQRGKNCQHCGHAVMSTAAEGLIVTDCNA